MALWRTGPDIQHADKPIYDQLEYLFADLVRLGVPYVVAGINTVEDITLAGDKIGALRITEGNVLLVRADSLASILLLGRRVAYLQDGLEDWRIAGSLRLDFGYSP